MSLLAFTKNAFGMFVAIVGAAADALLRAATGQRSHAARAQWLHRWCAFLLRRLSVPLEVVGSMPPAGLIVSNHLSYLDILVFAALAPCAFVSKKEVRRWPVFGLFAAISGTIFVDRTRPHLAQRSVEEIRETLAAGVRVVLFPEGTSTNGESVLPFKPALFESAVETQQPITASYLRYSLEDGDAAAIACYWGDMTFLPHLLRLMGQRRVTAHIHFAEQGSIFSDRKAAAVALQAEVLRLRQLAATSA